MKILLAEDERELSRALRAIIEHEGYEVDPAYDGEEAGELIQRNIYDIIILDIMMPKKDGITVLKELRDRGDVTPVLMLTAKSEIENRVEGLDAGADDYLTKPFAMKELLARIRSMARRNTGFNQGKLSFGNITFDKEILELSGTNSIRLSNKEAELLTYFMLNAEKECGTEELFEHIWREEEAENQVVWIYVSYLRKKLASVNADSIISGEKGGPYRLTNA